MNDQYELRKIQALVFAGIMTALVTSVTIATQIPLSSFGYLNLGDFAIMVLVCIAPIRSAVFAAGIGSAMADLLLGFPQYALFTLVIKSLEALILYWLRGFLPTRYRFISFVVAGLSMVLLYGATDAILLSQIEAMGVSIVANLPQGIVSALLAALLYPRYRVLEKYIKGKSVNEPKEY